MRSLPAFTPQRPLPAATSRETLEQALDVAGRLISSVGSTLLIVALALITLRLLRGSVKRIVARIMERGGEPSRELTQKASTLANVILSTGQLLIVIISGMMILANLGLDIGPLIASAGIAGVAIGLGAQSLIRDMINGFFILSENQFGVGDTITIGGFTGSVEEISLRRTVLRSANGAAIFVPNGEIRSVENLSKGWANAVLDIVVTPEADDAQVTTALNEVLANIQSDPQIGAFVLEPPRILGITAIGVTGVTFRVLIKTAPLQQWTVERELRRRTLQRFRERGIPLPTLTPAVLAPRDLSGS